MRFLRVARNSLAFALFASALAVPQAPATPDIPRLDFEKYTLPNGLQVILHVDRKLPMVHVNCWYHVGSKNERAGRTGFAHLFEHMMFEGSKDANDKYFGFIERAGANLFEGGVNGTTAEDRTNYFETVPSGNLDFVLWLESDRLATLTDVLTKKKLDNEREIVKNERRQGLENQPYGRAFMLISENVFPVGHPYQHDVIGSPEDLNAASVDDVVSFFKTYYTPNNLSLAVTGDFDPARAKELIAKYFGAIPPGPPLDRPEHWAPKLGAPKVLDVKDHVPQERTYFAWPSPAYFQMGDADLDLAQLVLTDGLSSRLYKSLVHDKQLCSDVVSFQNGMEIGGMFAMWATARPGARLGDVERGVDDEIARLATEGPSPEELNRAKAKWEFGYLTGLERIGGFGGQADVLNQYNTFLGDPDKFREDVQRHRDVTAASLRMAVASWLNTPNRVTLRFHPESLKADLSASLDRSKQPPFGTDRPFLAPEVKSARLENGMTVLVASRPGLPKVSAMLATRAGSAADLSGKEGLASLALEVMRRGTKTRSALQIDDQLGDLGTELGVHADHEISTISMDVLKRNLIPALAILADVTENPSFPADETERERKKRVERIAQLESQPSGLASRLSTMLAFGPNHPYGHPVQGFRETVQKLTAADLAQFHRQYWKPASSVLVLTGDISLDEATALAKSAFGSWAGGAAPLWKVGAPEPVGPGKIFLVNRPDAAQTYVEEILPGPTRDDASFHSFELADVVWGGGAGARLGMNLREQKGYSYGVFSFPQQFTHSGLWVAEGGVQTDKTKESVIEFEKELHFIAGEKPVTEAELANAKQFKTRGYAQQFESMSRVSQQIVELWSLNRPLSDLQDEPEELNRQTLAAVNASAEKYANPSRATLLLVGDSAKIEAGVRALNAGEVVVLDTEGRPTQAPSPHSLK
jgi:zinc protease